jgi:hypothetical protein
MLKKPTPPPTSPKPANAAGADELENSFAELDASTPDTGDELDDIAGALGDMDGSHGIPSPHPDFDPLAAIREQPGGTTEDDAKAEMNAMKAAFADAARKENDSYVLSNDSEYWFTVVFQTREQKDAFLQAVGWIKHGNKFLDGKWVAKKMGVEIPPAPAGLAYFLKSGDRLDKKVSALPVIAPLPKAAVGKGSGVRGQESVGQSDFTAD